MTDEDHSHQAFQNTDELLVFIKERSEDIDYIVIPQTLHLTTIHAGQQKEIYTGVGMIFHMISGQPMFIGRKDAEAVLNDGILQRMHLKISLLREDGDESDGITITRSAL